MAACVATPQPSSYFLEVDFSWLVAASTPIPDTSSDAASLARSASPVLDGALELPDSWSPIKTANLIDPADFLPNETSCETPEGTGRSDRTSITSDSPDTAGSTSSWSDQAASTSSFLDASGSFSANLHSQSSSAYSSSSSGYSSLSSSPVSETSLRLPKKDPPGKPAASHIEMIARAILSTTDHRLILGDIYAFILQHYPFYQTAAPTWRNAIRHNLTVNDCFVKAGRSNSGRGYFWTIHPACVDMFSKGDFRRMKARQLVQRMYKKMNSLPSKRGTSIETSQSPNKNALDCVSHTIMTSTPVYGSSNQMSARCSASSAVVHQMSSSQAASHQQHYLPARNHPAYYPHSLPEPALQSDALQQQCLSQTSWPSPRSYYSQMPALTAMSESYHHPHQQRYNQYFSDLSSGMPSPAVAAYRLSSFM